VSADGFMSSLLLMSEYSKSLLKSKLPIIAALVSIAVGLPVKAEIEQLDCKPCAVGYLAAAQCSVKNGLNTREGVDELIRNHLKKKPYFTQSFSWASQTSEGRAAVQATASLLKSDDCDVSEDFDEKIKEVRRSYMK
tara:strand:+ start:171 stop:581 length:411 start_codon:yes stop_codon:yes gene_type:complete